MQVIHLTYTPLAGAPIRIVQALNNYTEVAARLINLNPKAYGDRTFPEDLIWDRDTNKAKSLISNADLIVCHYPMELNNNKFGIHLKTAAKPSCKFIQHFHSNYFSYGDINPCLECFDAQSVIPHYPERSFLNIEILPNILPIYSESLIPPITQKSDNDPIEIIFSSSTKKSRFSRRWASKGYLEVSSKLKKLSSLLKFKYTEIVDTPYYSALEMRKKADILIGDIVSGSYHLTELEGLAQGKPVFCFLDGRSILTFVNQFKCPDIPFINVSIDEIDIVLKNLLKDRDLLNQIGRFSREWIEKYYDEKRLILQHVDFYKRVINGERPLRADGDAYSKCKKFLYNDVYDYIWQKKRNKSNLFFRMFNPKIKY